MTTSTDTDPCEAGCPFCQPTSESVIFERPLVIALWDAFPVNRGHALIIPRRHVATWFDATDEERAALMAAVDEARELIIARFAPDGVWWFGCGTVNAGWHVDPARLRQSGFADGAATRRALLDTAKSLSG